MVKDQDSTVLNIVMKTKSFTLHNSTCSCCVGGSATHSWAPTLEVLLWCILWAILPPSQVVWNLLRNTGDSCLILSCQRFISCFLCSKVMCDKHCANAGEWWGAKTDCLVTSSQASLEEDTKCSLQWMAWRVNPNFSILQRQFGPAVSSWFCY